MISSEGERQQLAYAQALADWGDLGGYDAEVRWDACTTEALGLPLSEAAGRRVATLSGGEQKARPCIRCSPVLRTCSLLDEPDNYLDVPSKRWFESPPGRYSQDRPARLARPRAPPPGCDSHRDTRAERRRGFGLGAWKRLCDVPRGARRPPGPLGGAPQAMGRGARTVEGNRGRVPPQRFLQLGFRRQAAQRPAPCGPLRRGRASRGGSPPTTHLDAPARRPHRQAGAHVHPARPRRAHPTL